ncbi:MAG: PAS domain S-box protein [Cephaloticoccus sp.]|nr:PAS domain S-box protein [Cephaloticoccus sp.]MCF7758920.1 PAS domain S-box protein [Cephaloticoccus sp.]
MSSGSANPRGGNQSSVLESDMVTDSSEQDTGGETLTTTVLFCRQVADGATLLAIILSLTVLAGWLLDWETIKALLPGATAMKPNTAVCFILLALALRLESETHNHSTFRERRIMAVTLGTLAGVVGILTLTEYVTGTTFSMDTWLFPNAQHAAHHLFPGRMSQVSAIGVVLLSLGVLLLDLEVRKQRPAQYLALAGAAIGFVMFSSYVLGERDRYAAVWFSAVSFPTAIILLALSVCILCIRPKCGFMTTVHSQDAGGWMVRRLLPVAVLVPLLLAWLRLEGEHTKLFHAEFGLALLTTAFTIAFAGFIWLYARTLNAHEVERRLSTAANAQLAAIVESSDDAIIGVDLNLIVTSWNHGAEKLFGFDSREILGKSVLQLLPPDLASEEAGILSQLQQGESVSHYETVRLRKDGTSVDISLTVSPIFDPRGKLVGASKVSRDISKRRKAEADLRESEARFRQIAENVNDVIRVTDPVNQQMLYVSPRFENIWGRSCAELYRSPEIWQNSIHPEDRARIAEAARTKQITGKYDETYRIERPDQKLRWIQERAFPVRDASGVVYRLVLLAADITEQHTLEMQLRQTQKLEALGTLAGGIAHDFNNILSAIMGYTELARMSAKDLKTKEFLEPVAQATQRAADLIRQILAFSRQQEQQRAPLQLRLIIAESLKLLRATIPTTIEIEGLLHRDLLNVLADATQIHQIIMNLGTNAWHAMRGNKSGRLTVELEEFNADELLARSNQGFTAGPYVRLSVSDNGQGMDRETMDHIFEPFFTTKGPGEGTGLGLSVVHGIVKSHGGVITVYSQQGQGTTFRLYFPALAAISTETSTDSVPIPAGQGQQVLLIDDEPVLAELGGRILEQLGYKPVTKSDPVEALALIRSDPYRFDLVITDMMMPKMTGLDLTRELQAIRPNLPIILTSGYMGAASEKQLHNQGIREVLPKPPTIRSVGLIVHRVLSQ